VLRHVRPYGFASLPFDSFALNVLILKKSRIIQMNMVSSYAKPYLSLNSDNATPDCFKDKNIVNIKIPHYFFVTITIEQINGGFCDTSLNLFAIEDH